MPKRILDGEGIWRSDKLARVEPVWMRAEYANLIPLALANGVLEANPRRIWSQVYAYNRTDITTQDVEKILEEFGRVGLLFRWVHEDGKIWGFWTNIKKPGRLPSQSRLNKKHETTGPEPPTEELEKYTKSTNGNQWLTNGRHGLGLGFGLGTGSGRLSSSSEESSSDVSVSSSPTPDEARLKASIRTVWTYYTETFHKNPKVLTLTADREKKGLARLRECMVKTGGDIDRAVELLKIAIDALAGSRFHMGANNSKKTYVSWEKHLFKSQEKLEEWLEASREQHELETGSEELCSQARA